MLRLQAPYKAGESILKKKGIQSVITMSLSKGEILPFLLHKHGPTVLAWYNTLHFIGGKSRSGGSCLEMLNGVTAMFPSWTPNYPGPPSFPLWSPCTLPLSYKPSPFYRFFWEKVLLTLLRLSSNLWSSYLSSQVAEIIGIHHYIQLYFTFQEKKIIMWWSDAFCLWGDWTITRKTYFFVDDWGKIVRHKK